MPLPGIPAEDYPSIAGRLGITKEHVWDLASDRNAVAMTLSVAQLVELSKVTGLGLRTLTARLGRGGQSMVKVTPQEFCERLMHVRESSTVSGEGFDSAVGWDIPEIVGEPKDLLKKTNWDCLNDLAAIADIDPYSLLL